MKAEPLDSSATITPTMAINFLKRNNLTFNFGNFDFTGGFSFGGSGYDNSDGLGSLKFGDPGQLSLSMAELHGKRS
ncbi:hypothetical protein DPMN_125665 [Dreissena polymorpha]|uniref:Uncharacterized protein n=1 Tax=Dreissena polymorpha TaxID=45954 RepID=A0A9D4GVU9_DREPO|nr:hypothetical protein DPMN_125665 [Dreissena polymorpha]